MRRRITVPCLMGILLSATGCRVGPDYQRPTLPQGAEDAIGYPAVPAYRTDQAPDEWWTLYQDALLDRYVREALGANYDLKIAMANVAAANAVLVGAKAGLTPQTETRGEGTFGRNAVTDEILELQGKPPATTWLLEDLLQVGYEVDLWGRVRRTIEAAHADAAAEEATRDAVRIAIAADVTATYAHICTLGEALTVAHHSLDIVNRERDIMQQRNQAGANNQFDVVRAEGIVAEVQATLPPIEGHRQAALFELAALLGRTPEGSPEEATHCLVAPALNSAIPIGDGITLLKRRPDVREADRHLAAAIARIGIATADLYPRVTIAGLYGGVGFTGGDLLSAKGLAWGIGPSVDWAFPNQAVPRARIRLAKANGVAALAAFDSTVLRALKETQQSLAEYSAELRHRESLKLTQRKAQMAFALANNMFVAGSVSYLELLTTEESLVVADAAVAASDAAIVAHQIAVFKALGGGWQHVSSPQ